MKSVFIFFTFLALVVGGTIPTRDLQDDLNDFLALIPVDEILPIALDYVSNDAEVQITLAYLQSDKFHYIIESVEKLTEFHNFIDFLRAHGLDATEFLNQVHIFVNLPLYEQTGVKITCRGGRVKSLIDDIIALLPVDKLRALFDEKLESSPDFKALYNEIHGDEFQDLLQKVRDIPEYQELLEKLHGYGVDVDHIIGVLRGLFGITGEGSPLTRDFPNCMDVILTLIPVDEIAFVFVDYLSNDIEVKEALAYFKSDQFHNIITSFEGLTEYKNIIHFLQEHGVDPVDFINQVHNIIDLAPYVGEAAKSTRQGEGVEGLLNDIITLLPVDALKTLFNYLSKDCSEFQELYDAIHGDEFQGLLQKLRDMPEYQELRSKFIDYGVDFEHYIQVIKTLLDFE